MQNNLASQKCPAKKGTNSQIDKPEKIGINKFVRGTNQTLTHVKYLIINSALEK